MFSRTDTVTDSERFYNSVLELLEDDDEKEEVQELMIWWNRYRVLLVLRFPYISQLLFSSTPCCEEQRSSQDSGEEGSEETGSAINNGSCFQRCEEGRSSCHVPLVMYTYEQHHDRLDGQ